MKGEPGRGGEGEGAPRGQDDSAAGRKVAVAARRRSARPTPARRGPWAAAAAVGDVGGHRVERLGERGEGEHEEEAEEV